MLDLNDLYSVARASDAFAAQETRLDVLWNNAGPGANVLPAGAKTAQGLEAMTGIYYMATMFLTVRLLPLLRSPMLHETKSGAYTELFADLAPEVTREGPGYYSVPLSACGRMPTAP